MSHLTEQELEDMEALFVQTTASRPSDGQTLNPQGLSPSTSYFSGSVLLLKHHRRVRSRSSQRCMEVERNGDPE